MQNATDNLWALEVQ